MDVTRASQISSSKTNNSIQLNPDSTQFNSIQFNSIQYFFPSKKLDLKARIKLNENHRLSV
jgi:hypothetical protein